MNVHALVVAKAPEPGLVKTRLGAKIGMERAADLACASLLDTIMACTAAVGAELCHLSLAGHLDRAVGAAQPLPTPAYPARSCRSAWTRRRSPPRSCSGPRGG